MLWSKKKKGESGKATTEGGFLIKIHGLKGVFPLMFQWIVGYVKLVDSFSNPL